MTPLEQVSEAVFQHIERMGTYFKPDAKITVLVRFPGKPNADFVVTTDELKDVAEMVERRQQAGITSTEERINPWAG